MNYRDNILDLIGNTPLVKIHNGRRDGGPLLLAKIEFVNPGGSVKDRMAYFILKKALKEGKIKPGGTVIDNTSGNAGVALAMAATVLGLNAILTTPEKTSKEKVDQIKAFGAEVIVTPADLDHDDPEGCVMKAINLAKEHGYFHMNQYHSQDNILAHYTHTGPEIWDATEGRITHLVAGIGTGGTLSGAARFLKEKNPNIRAIAVDPVGSIFSEFIKHHKNVPPQAYKIEGIGSDVETQALDPSVVDEVITVSDEIAFQTARKLAREEGILGGGSSGAAVYAARQVAERLDGNTVMVVIIPDSGTKYLSKCFNDDWMRANGFLVEAAEYKRAEVT
ncbi:MAG: cysteine synthase family protein [candidate division Zixibacteria bacterium]|nr:cysteine synthase family protein [candidate division Zixibacteria bacterium]